MAIKTASDLDIFTILSQTTSSVTYKELAARKNADGQLVGQYHHYSYPPCYMS